MSLLPALLSVSEWRLLSILPIMYICFASQSVPSLLPSSYSVRFLKGIDSPTFLSTNAQARIDDCNGSSKFSRYRSVQKRGSVTRRILIT